MTAKTIPQLTYGGGALNPLSLIPLAPLASGSSGSDPTLNTYGDAVCAFLQDLAQLLSGGSASLPAAEALAAGDLVNIFTSGGVAKMQKANATDLTKPAHGFVTAAVASAATGNVFFDGQIDAHRSALTPGAAYYLDTTGGAITAAAPSGAGNLEQIIGVALSATTLAFFLGGYRALVAADIPSNELITTIPLLINGGGATIAAGYAGHTSVDYSGTIVGVTLLGKGSGSIVVDIYKTTYANFDGGATHPVAGDSICAAAKPTISAATKAQDTTLTGWTKAITAGDILWFNVDSATTFQNVTVALKVQKT